MFVQAMEGRVGNPQALRRQLDVTFLILHSR
jgi:hypothetical protein